MSTDKEDIREEAASFLIRMGEAPSALNGDERDKLGTFKDRVATDPRLAHEFHAMAIIGAMAVDLSKADRERWEAEAAATLSAEEPAKPRVWARPWMAIAASVLMACVLGTAVVSYRVWFAGETYTTGTGQNRTVTFEDGSVAHLNTRTEVRWTGDTQDRRLELVEGEALFDVVHDASRPFRVVLNGSEIRVLGTRFNVYKKSSGDTTVTVLEGVVEVRGRSDGGAQAEWVRTLRAGEQIEYRKLGLIKEPHATEAQTAILWRNGAYNFDEKPVEEVLEELTRYTDQHIVIRDPRIADIPVSGTLDTRDVRESLRRLQVLAPIEVKQNNNTFILDYRAQPGRGKD